MKAAPDLMAPALALHNAAVRRAAFANAGSVLEQEGDSYVVAFHEPFDAAVFCLQVQLLLQALDWPRGLPSPKALALGAAAAEAAGGGGGAGGGAGDGGGNGGGGSGAPSEQEVEQRAAPSSSRERPVVAGGRGVAAE